MPLDALPTPALLVDGEAMDRNLAKMAAHLHAHGVGLRPHAKTHKSADIARKQLALGAVGLCCAKVSEAEALAAAGIGPLLVTSPLATRDKVARFAVLATRQPEALLVVDSAVGVDLAAEAATTHGVELGVLIDLDVGTRRTGVACGDPAIALARHAAAKPRLRVRGVQAYAGHLMHVSGFEQRRQRSLAAMAGAAETRAAIEAAGIPCPVFTGGGTGTFDIDTAVPGITDLQCGSYPFMDVQYRVIGGPDGDLLDAFEPALFVWSTVISRPAPGRVTLDAGIKALAYDWKRPALPDYRGAEYSWGGDEHGIVAFPEGAAIPALGERVKIFVSHCDPTVNLHDAYHVVRGGAVTERWPVTARGCCQ
jgi:D-serine deaminase-like pyridoxal phosphate-dependent protein